MTYEVETVYYWLLGAIKANDAYGIRLENTIIPNKSGYAQFTFRIDRWQQHSKLLQPRFGPGITKEHIIEALSQIYELTVRLR